MKDKDVEKLLIKTAKEIEQARSFIKELEKDIQVHRSNITYLLGYSSGVRTHYMEVKKCRITKGNE